MSLWLTRSCPSWSSTDSMDLTKSSEANGSGSLWVSREAAKRDAIWTIVKMVKYHVPCLVSHPPGAFRDHLHLRPLWFCQLQLARDCDWRPVWVFDHSCTIWCYCFLGNDRLKCFPSHKASICPPRRGDISSMVLRAMITGTCVSLVNACIAGMRFSNTSGLLTILKYWTCFQLNLFSKGSCFFLLLTAWLCSRDRASTPQILMWWHAAQTFSKSECAPH